MTKIDIDALAMTIAVEMEVHAALSTTTRAKGDAITKLLEAALSLGQPAPEGWRGISELVNSNRKQINIWSEIAEDGDDGNEPLGAVIRTLKRTTDALAMLAATPPVPHPIASAEPQPVAGIPLDVRIEELAKWIHSEVEWPEYDFPDASWPDHPDDDGKRGNGYLRIIPRSSADQFRDIAARIIRSALIPAPDASTIASQGERVKELEAALLSPYCGLLVLKTMLRKLGLQSGADVAEKAIADLVALHPVLPALSSLRTTPEPSNE